MGGEDGGSGEGRSGRAAHMGQGRVLGYSFSESGQGTGRNGGLVHAITFQLARWPSTPLAKQCC